MSGNNVFDLVTGHSWNRGLANMLRIEFARWWKTRTWWVQSIIWVFIVDSIIFLVMFMERTEGGNTPPLELFVIFSILGGISAAVGVVITMQGAIIGEKQSGTAAWVLSKPVTRTSFVIAKLIGNAFGVIITAILVPGIVAYIAITLFGDGTVPIINFLSGISIMALHTLFWLTVTLTLGTVFNSRGAVIGIPLGLLLGYQIILGLVPWVTYIIPYQLVIPMGSSEENTIAVALINGQTPESWLPLLTAVVMIVLLTALGIWRFSREEF